MGKELLIYNQVDEGNKRTEETEIDYNDQRQLINNNSLNICHCDQ